MSEAIGGYSEEQEILHGGVDGDGVVVATRRR